MSTNKKPLPTEPHEQAAHNGVAVELNDEAVRNLTGFFDVLIQMDLAAKQGNERNEEDGNGIQPNPTIATQDD